MINPKSCTPIRYGPFCSASLGILVGSSVGVVVIGKGFPLMSVNSSSPLEWK